MNIQRLADKLIHKKGWSITDLAKKIGSNRSAVSRFLSGPNPDGKNLRLNVLRVAFENGMGNLAIETLLGRTVSKEELPKLLGMTD